MDCSIAEKNINSLIRGTLKGKELRRTYFHLKKCARCKEVLLDEFSFYMTFNDLDKYLNYNYKENLEKILAEIEHNIRHNDSILRQNYYIASILICVFVFLLLVFALRMVYR